MLPSEQPKMIKPNVFNRSDNKNKTNKILFYTKWGGVSGGLKEIINITLYGKFLIYKIYLV